MAYIYHYSTELYENLLTREEQNKRGLNVLSQEDKIDQDNKAKFRSRKYPYYKELSFMIDKLPFDIILKGGFDPDHKVYKSGNAVYCYYVDVEKLPKMYWQLIESPVDSFMSKIFFINVNWYKKIFFRIKSLLKQIQRYETDDMDRLNIVIDKFKGTYPSSYTKWINSKEFEKQKHMYAASIPHIQLYPSNGEIKFDKVEKLIL